MFKTLRLVYKIIRMFTRFSVKTLFAIPRQILKTILTVMGVFIVYQAILRLVRRYWKFPAPAVIGRFLDSDLRRKMQPVNPLIEHSGVRSGMTILEVGCGSGAYTTYTARSAGMNGRVYALDIQSNMLKQIKAKLVRPENQDLSNIQPIQSSAYELPFNANSFDLIYLVTVLQEIPDKDRLLTELRRALKSGGYLAVSEFLPDPDYPWVTTTIQQCKSAGFRLDDVSGNLWTYTVRFKK